MDNQEVFELVQEKERKLYLGLFTKGQLILITSVILGALLAALLVFGLFLYPLVLADPIDNTVEDMLFDIDDLSDTLLNDKGGSFLFESDLQSTVSNLRSNLNIKLEESFGGKKNPVGSLKLELKSASSSIKVELWYNEEIIAVKGLNKDNDNIYTVSRKSFEEDMEGSVFHYESGTKYALSEDEYISLISAMKQLNGEISEKDRRESEDERILREFIARVNKKYREILSPKLSFRFFDGGIKLCKKIEYDLSADDMRDLFDVVYEEVKEDEETKRVLGIEDADDLSVLRKPFTELKNKLGDAGFYMSYVVSGGRIAYINVRLTEREKLYRDITLRFYYNKTDLGFDLEFLGEETEDPEDRSYEMYRYRRTKTDSVTNLAVGYANSEKRVEYMMKEPVLSLEYDEKTGAYKYLEKADIKNQRDKNFSEITGTFVMNKNTNTLFFSIDKYKRAGKITNGILTPSGEWEGLLKIDIKPLESKLDVQVPEGTNIVSLNEGQVEQMMRDLPLMKLSQMQLDILGTVNNNYYYTSSGQVVFNGPEVYRHAQIYHTMFRDYEAQNGHSMTPEKIYIYSKEHDLYYIYEKYQDVVYFEYELTDELIQSAHVSVEENNKLKIHETTLIKTVEADCTTRGQIIYSCSICEKEVSEPTGAALGHKLTERFFNVTADDNKQYSVIMEYCSVCKVGVRSLTDGIFAVHCERREGKVYITGYGSDFREYICIPDDYADRLGIEGFANIEIEGDYVSVRIPKGVKKLEAGTKILSEKIQVIIIPKSVTEIEDGVFADDLPLRKIFYCGTETEWENVNLNGYAEAWKNVEVVFAPEGVSAETAYKSSVAQKGTAAALAEKKKQVESADVGKALAEKEGVSFIDTGKVSVVAACKEIGMIAVIGAYDGTKSDVKIYDINTYAVKKQFSVPAEIHSAEFADGILAMASKELKAYVYRADSGALKEIEVDGNPRNKDYVRQVLIADGIVYIATEDQHCDVVRYDPKTQKSSVAFECYQPQMYYNDEKKRIVAITLQLYPPFMVFYDTENQEIIATEWYENSNNPVVFKGDYIELRNGEKYDMNGKLVTDVPEEKPMQDIKLSGYEAVCKELIDTERVAVALYVDVGYKTGVVLQNSDGASVKLDYYADNAIILRDDLVLIYSVGGEGVILAELK